MSDQAMLDEGTVTSPDTADQPAAPEYVPAFWRSDYKRFAAVLKLARATQGSFGATLKGGTAQATVDAAAAVLAEVFGADSEAAGRQPGDKYYFDAEKFMAGTRLASYEITSQDDDEDDEDYDEDYDEDDEDDE